MNSILSSLREDIDLIDDQIVDLIEKRLEIGLNIAKYKQHHALPILDQDREMLVIKRLEQRVKNQTLKDYIGQIYPKIFAVTKEIMKNTK